MKKKISFFILTILIFVIIITLFFYFYKNDKDNYSIKGNRIYYSKDRGKVKYNLILREENFNYSIYNISFYTKKFLEDETKIYGLLFLPKKDYSVPGVVIAPGGGVEKEKRIDIARFIANSGYSVLVIDQRGIGETGGIYLNLDDDYKMFSSGKEPIQHLSVYDILRSYDVLKNIKGVDKDNIALVGESMGGRYCIIAGGIDKRIKGVIVVSSSGFDFKYDPYAPYSTYLLSIDPDNYVDRISPNYFFMLHSVNDSVVTLESAKKTFNKANEPKNFSIYDDKSCMHGFCEKMYPDIVKYLKIIFNKTN
ncbi:MAG: alpha/beta hydrolase [Candidatus Pacearchaeota archaeon]